MQCGLMPFAGHAFVFNLPQATNPAGGFCASVAGNLVAHPTWARTG